jgi:HlyD family secretion protein
VEANTETERQQEDSINIRSNEIDDILGRKPAWILRRGVVVLTFIVISLLIASWLFKYPDIVTATVVITISNPPEQIIAKTSGKIQTLLVTDNQFVKKGDYLAIIENPAQIEEVIKLREIIAQYDTLVDINLIDSIEITNIANLGMLQSNYQAFLQAIIDLKQYNELSFNKKIIEKLKNQVVLIKAYNKKLKSQENLQKEILNIANKQYKRDSFLLGGGAVSESEYENSKKMMLSSKSSYEGASITYINSQIQLNQIEQQILELSLTYDQEVKQYKDNINTTYRLLQASFNEWESLYVLKSNYTGRVSLGNYWSTAQSVNVGDVVMSIISDDITPPFGKVVLPMQNSGKVKVGQKVNIKLLNYPYTEYGVLKATIKNISLAPEQGNYYIELNLDNGLTTSYNKKLDFLQEMSGIAEIITEDMRLLTRIFAPIKTIIKENT